MYVAEKEENSYLDSFLSLMENIKLQIQYSQKYSVFYVLINVVFLSYIIHIKGLILNLLFRQKLNATILFPRSLLPQEKKKNCRDSTDPAWNATTFKIFSRENEMLPDSRIISK